MFSPSFHNTRTSSRTRRFVAWAYFFALASIIVLAVIMIAAAAYRGAVALEERKLVERARTIALSLEPREIAFLVGDISDLGNPFYVSLKKRLADIIRVNPDIRFVYLAGEKEGNIFFYLDSEPEDSLAHSPPGQVYTEASAAFYEVFDTGLPRFEGPLADRWGEWVSAFVAINHPRTGERLAVLGVDIAAFEYKKHILLAMMVPILFVLVLFLVFLIGYIRYKKEKEILYLKAEFLSIAAHDLRAPLTGVLWAIEALRKTSMPTEAIETIEKIEYTLKFMKENIQGILASSRLLRSGLPVQAGAKETPSSADIPLIIANVVEGLEFTAREHDVSVFVDNALATPKNIYTPAPAEKVRHIFANIISNAIKYSKGGGRIDVSYTFEGGKHVVSVKDSGIGIPDRDQRKIFSEHFRASNNASKEGGAGLGLYFTKHLVDECGGSMWFASEESMGTKFYVELPASVPVTAGKPAMSPDKKS